MIDLSSMRARVCAYIHPAFSFYRVIIASDHIGDSSVRECALTLPKNMGYGGLQLANSYCKAGASTGLGANQV